MPITSPLRVLARNPRYFTDDSGQAIYLTGSHTWANFQDNGLTMPPRSFDYVYYLDWLAGFNHNFIRLWVWEQAAFCPWSDEKEIFDPLPYQRPGPDLALDGRPKFDLTRFNPDYFDRLRTRVIQAGERGIYVSIMLFQGWSQKKGYTIAPYDPWPGHPFNLANNINGINGDKNGDSVVDYADPEVRALHAAYIYKVIDTVNDLDNVLYEVINEGGEKEWDWFVLDTIHAYQRTKPQQHPAGLTGHGRETTTEMLASPANWISPGENCDPSYKTDPTAWDAGKPSLFDTDHVFGIGGDEMLVWKAFLRGHNFVFMDPWDRKDQVLDRISDTIPGQVDASFDPLRKAMGCTRVYAEKMPLATMTPHDALTTTGYCLADPGTAYLVFLPDGGEATIDLTAACALTVEWMHPVSGAITPGETVYGGASRTLAAPFTGPAVLYLSSH
jgi:hypothetical protein